MQSLNPFIYGGPVPVNKHFNREKALRRIFSRIQNGESTAIVGESGIGKTSLLHYVAHPNTQKKWLHEPLIVVELDFYSEWLNPTKTPQDFWQYVFKMLQEKLPNTALQRQINLVRESQFEADNIKRFFRNVSRIGGKIILLIDEFDALLHHPNFSTNEFLGSLRSMVTTTTGGLQLITASIISVQEMNNLTKEQSYGSPFFNNLTDVSLPPFADNDVDKLLDTLLNGTGITFNHTDRRYIKRLSGRHPFRVQVASASLFDAIQEGIPSADRYKVASEYFYDRTTAHFDYLWHRYLDSSSQTLMVILSLMELNGMAQGRKFSYGEIERTQRFAPELKKLMQYGLVEQVETGRQVDIEHLLLWQDGRYRVACSGFLYWLTNVIISGTRNIPDFDQWLLDQEKVAHIITKKQLSTIQSLASKIPQSALDNIAGLTNQIIKGFI